MTGKKFYLQTEINFFVRSDWSNWPYVLLDSDLNDFHVNNLVPSIKIKIKIKIKEEEEEVNNLVF